MIRKLNLGKLLVNKLIILTAFAFSTQLSINFVFAQGRYQQQQNESPKDAEQDEHMTDIDRRLNDIQSDRGEKHKEALDRTNIFQNKLDDVNGRLHFDEGIGAAAWALIGIGQIVIYRKDKDSKSQRG